MIEVDLQVGGFDDWVKAIFARPLSHHAWYSYTSINEPPAETCVEYLSKLFSNCEILDDYLDQQVNDGLFFLISSGCSDHAFAISQKEVPLAKRIACIESIGNLFSEFLDKRCSEHLSHLSPPDANPINSVTYMWWDSIAIGAPAKDAEDEKLNQAILAVINSTLNLPSIACQESALHGLGHKHYMYPSFVEDTINEYIASHRELRSELLNYAIAARSGCVN